MLVDELKTHLGDSFVLFTKAAGFHWNVEGPHFPQYHEFLGDLYAEIYGSVDKTAEYIRTLDVYAPGSMAEMLGFTQLKEEKLVLLDTELFQQLYNDLETVIEHLDNTFDVAAAERNQAIANYIADRIDAYEKHCWMLRSIIKRV